MDELGGKFWLWVVGVALAVGIGGMILFSIIGAAWYAWGAFGTIIFISAKASVWDIAHGLELGGLDYLTKPFDPSTLAPVIRNLLARIGRGERELVHAERLDAVSARLASTPRKS